MRSISSFIYPQPLYRIVLCIIFLVVLWAWLGRQFAGRRGWRIANAILCAVSLAAILQLTFTGRGGDTEEVVLIPFYSLVEAQKQPEMYRTLLMNLFLFVPFGLSFSNVLPKGRSVRACAILTIVSACALSVGILLINLDKYPQLGVFLIYKGGYTMKLYHGSEHRIEQPEYGKGKPYNDYGRGFYCTEDIEMAKEWGCSEEHDGFANCYELDLSDLKILNLNDPEYTILHWLTILLEHRTFRVSSPIAREAKAYLVEHFHIDVKAYDVIIGYRADDSYFSFAEDFLNNGISLRKLAQAMRLGRLGEQVVLTSERAFSKIDFREAAPAERAKYYVLKMRRDRQAREEYRESRTANDFRPDDLYMLDILRQEVKADDSRLR